MSVHYKFKSNLDYDTVTFDGLHISVADLKKAIMQQKKIGKSSDFDLEITNAQTKEVYDNEETLVPKNTSVIVARVPVAAGNKKTWEKPDLPLPIDDGDSLGQIRYDKLAKSADLVNSTASEDDKVKAMITQSSQEYDPSKYVKSRSMTGPLPPSYTCYRCGKQGHWIRECPTNNLDIKRSTGIPRSFMVPVDGPEHKGALLTSSGDYAVPIIDHQAYKEVKKEKPPFVQDTEPTVEMEAQVPEELLCMVCRDLLQDAVLIPCCGNSFCDECVRQVLLDSDNNECPQCHETGISPDTVIPNRFLRTAVLNFKNETGYTRARRLAQSEILQQQQHLDSPQPSPDSTVETQPTLQEIAQVESDITSSKTAESDVTPKSDLQHQEKHDNFEPQAELHSDSQNIPEAEDTEQSNMSALPVDNSEEIQDIQPGTPLADEPSVDAVSESLPIQTIDHEHYDDRQDYHEVPFADYTYGHNSDSRDGHVPSDHGQISTISTITNTRKRFQNWAPQPRQHYPPPRHHERPESYDMRDRTEYRGRYDRRGHGAQNNRSLQRPHSGYERSPRDARCRRNENRRDYNDYSTDNEHIADSCYEPQPVGDALRRRRHYDKQSPSTAVTVTTTTDTTAPHTLEITPPYTALPPQPAHILPNPQTFPPQPPPPGASPIDTSHIPPQPPPPGVGPLLPAPPAALREAAASFETKSYDSEDKAKPPKTEERSIDDRLEAFQRELDKRERQSARDRSSRSSSSRSRESRKRSRSASSRSKSYSSSKSWSRSPSRSVSRSSRSRTRSSYTSRSRSRSFSRTRSRTRTKSRSYSPRSRTRSRTKSRSRSRDHHRGSSRERTHTPATRSNSASLSPKSYHSRNRRSPYQIKRVYNPPQYTSSYPPPYAAPPAPIPTVLPVAVMRPPLYPATHMPPVHPAIHSQPPVHTHPIDHYAMDRQRYSHYTEQYSSYDVYQPQQKSYSHQRYEREPRNTRYDKQQPQQPQDYQKDYQRHSIEVQHRIPGWVGDRGREYKPRYRIPRDQQRKEIRELPKEKEQPKTVESEVRVVRTRETRQEAPVKKKEEKAVKHKKHHHHRSKESKKQDKQENKIPVVIGVEKTPDTPENLIKVEVLPSRVVESKIDTTNQSAEISEKTKEKKHKHKKHKTGDQITKKKKTQKKDKSDAASSSTDIAGKKGKKKKNKKLQLEGKKKPGKSTIKSNEGNQHVKTSQSASVPDKVKKENKIESVKSHSDEEFVSGIDNSEVSHDIEKEEESKPIESEVPIVSEAYIQEEEEEEEGETTEGKENLAGSYETSENFNAEAANSEEEEQDEEREEEENVDDEDEFHIELPALSKWEREEFEREEEILSKPQRKSAVVIPKDDKGSLSTEIIQRAEKAILHKALKTAIVSTHKNEKKSSNKTDAPESPVIQSSKNANISEIKRSSSAERSRSPTLQVTIITDKEKRSVHAKSDNNQKERSKDDSQPLKKVKLDRSNFPIKAEPTSLSTVQRIVTVAESSDSLSKSEEKSRIKTIDKKSETKRERIKVSAPEKDSSESRSSYHERKEYSARMYEKERERMEHQRRRSHSHDDKRRNYNFNERNREHGDVSYHPPERIDRNRRNIAEYNVQDRDKRYFDKGYGRPFERPPRDRYNRRSRSRSYDSSDSYSNDRRHRNRKDAEYLNNPPLNRHDTRRKEETTSKYYNESSLQSKRINLSKSKGKFELERNASHTRTRSEPYPAEGSYGYKARYDDYSDEENNRHVVTERAKGKRSLDQPEHSRKRSKHEQPLEDSVSSTTHDVEIKREKRKSEKISVSTSPSSSASVESDSSNAESTAREKGHNSDSDHKQKHKKSRHKKHKKHKHKHKKKKSHKSKQKS